VVDRLCRESPELGSRQPRMEGKDSGGSAPGAQSALSVSPTFGRVWNLTGGPEGGVHVTDVTNAGRTLLMDLEKLEWSAELLDPFRRAGRHAAGDPLLGRGLRRGKGRAGRRAGGGNPG
jgi:hypothetical protein